MILTNIDTIVRRQLLEKSLPVHWYMEFLVHAAACLRELSIDTLKIINTVQLPVDDLGSVLLPDDFQDDVAVSFNNAGIISKIPQQDYISPIRTHNTTTGAYENPSPSASEAVTDSYFFNGTTWGWFWPVNSYGEFTGGFFGANAGTSMGYKIIREQRRIQMSAGFAGESIILMYVSDGQSIDNASQIDIKAQNCIQQYIAWKSSPNAAILQSAEGQSFFATKRNLKARLNPMTVTDVRQILLSSYTGSIKN